jgi:hypothetical protein
MALRDGGSSGSGGGGRGRPGRLLGLGAPKDGYDPEVAERAGMAHSGQQLTAGVIVAVFDRWFEPGACSLVQAERIAALLVTWQ